jgi:hypothetical protein
MRDDVAEVVTVVHHTQDISIEARDGAVNGDAQPRGHRICNGEGGKAMRRAGSVEDGGVLVDALRMFRARMINAAVGCAVGLIVLITGGSSEWKLPIAISIAVLVSSYFVRVPTMWRQAPITAAIIIASGLEQHSKLTGVEQGLRRVGEVLLGCVVGLIVSWLMSYLWPMPATRFTETANR